MSKPVKAWLIRDPFGAPDQVAYENPKDVGLPVEFGVVEVMIVDREEWDRIQEILKEVSDDYVSETEYAGEMLQLCHWCGNNMDGYKVNHEDGCLVLKIKELINHD